MRCEVKGLVGAEPNVWSARRMRTARSRGQSAWWPFCSCWQFPSGSLTWVLVAGVVKSEELRYINQCVYNVYLCLLFSSSVSRESQVEQTQQLAATSTPPTSTPPTLPTAPLTAPTTADSTVSAPDGGAGSGAGSGDDENTASNWMESASTLGTVHTCTCAPLTSHYFFPSY